MAVQLVVTEYPGALTTARRRHYERIRRRLQRAAGVDVQSSLYTDVDSLRRARAVVLSGSFAPWAAHDPKALSRLREVVGEFRGPVLGICAGMQLQAMFTGGSVAHSERPEKGYGAIEVIDDGDLLEGLPERAVVYQHHTDEVVTVPEGFTVLARSPSCSVQAIAHRERRWWGTQFHPERFDGEHPAGERVLRNFFQLARISRVR